MKKAYARPGKKVIKSKTKSWSLLQKPDCVNTIFEFYFQKYYNQQ